MDPGLKFIKYLGSTEIYLSFPFKKKKKKNYKRIRLLKINKWSGPPFCWCRYICSYRSPFLRFATKKDKSKSKHVIGPKQVLLFLFISHKSRRGGSFCLEVFLFFFKAAFNPFVSLNCNRDTSEERTSFSFNFNRIF